MKMTIHQRLRAQRKAEHWKAKRVSHQRQVAQGRDGGLRCYDCWSVPLTKAERAAMSHDEVAEYQRDFQWHATCWASWHAGPSAADPKLWHHVHALGYDA